MYYVQVHYQNGKIGCVSYETKEAAVNGIAYAYRNFGNTFAVASVKGETEPRCHIYDSYSFLLSTA